MPPLWNAKKRRNKVPRGFEPCAPLGMGPSYKRTKSKVSVGLHSKVWVMASSCARIGVAYSLLHPNWKKTHLVPSNLCAINHLRRPPLFRRSWPGIGYEFNSRSSIEDKYSVPQQVSQSFSIERVRVSKTYKKHSENSPKENRFFWSFRPSHPSADALIDSFGHFDPHTHRQMH